MTPCLNRLIFVNHKVLITKQFKNQFSHDPSDKRLLFYKIAQYLDENDFKPNIRTGCMRFFNHAEIRIQQLGVKRYEPSVTRPIGDDRNWMVCAVIGIRLTRVEPAVWYEELITGVGSSRENAIEDASRYYCKSSLPAFLTLLTGHKREGVLWWSDRSSHLCFLVNPYYVRGDAPVVNLLELFLFEESPIIEEIYTMVCTDTFSSKPSLVCMMCGCTPEQTVVKAWLNNDEHKKLTSRMQVILNDFDSTKGFATLKLSMIIFSKSF